MDHNFAVIAEQACNIPDKPLEKVVVDFQQIVPLSSFTVLSNTQVCFVKDYRPVRGRCSKICYILHKTNC